MKTTYLLLAASLAIPALTSGAPEREFTVPAQGDTLRIPLSIHKNQACMDTLQSQKLQNWVSRLDLDRIDRDSLLSALERRDSVAQATLLHWKLQSELQEAKNANWQQGWNELLAQHQTCTQALRIAIEAATPQAPPPSPLLPRITAAATGILVGFLAGWLVFGL